MADKITKVDTILAEGESVAMRIKPKVLPFSLKKSATAIFAGLVLIAIFIVFALSFNNDLSMSMLMNIFKNASFGGFKTLFTIVFLVLPIALISIRIILAIMEHKNTEYVVTNKRVFISSGVLGVDCDHIYFYDIDSVRADVTFFEKIFGVGTVILASDSKGYAFRQISDVYKIANEIQAITRTEKTDALYPNDKRQFKALVLQVDV